MVKATIEHVDKNGDVKLAFYLSSKAECEGAQEEIGLKTKEVEEKIKNGMSIDNIKKSSLIKTASFLCIDSTTILIGSLWILPRNPVCSATQTCSSCMLLHPAG